MLVKVLGDFVADASGRCSRRQVGWSTNFTFFISLSTRFTHTRTHTTLHHHTGAHTENKKKDLKTNPDRVHCRVPRANHAQCGGTLHVLCPQQYTNIPQYLSPVAHHKIIFFEKKIIIFMLCLPFSPLPLSLPSCLCTLANQHHRFCSN